MNENLQKVWAVLFRGAMNPLEALLAQTFQCGEAASGTWLPLLSFGEGARGRAKDIDLDLLSLQRFQEGAFSREGVRLFITL